jgi:hypothetical protein
MIEFGLEFERKGYPNPPEGKLYMTHLPGEEEENKHYISDEALEPLDMQTYIELMIANLKRLRKQAHKKLSASRKGLA